jgi:hypothetical protein
VTTGTCVEDPYVPAERPAMVSSFAPVTWEFPIIAVRTPPAVTAFAIVAVVARVAVAEFPVQAKAVVAVVAVTEFPVQADEVAALPAIFVDHDGDAAPLDIKTCPLVPFVTKPEIFGAVWYKTLPASPPAMPPVVNAAGAFTQVNTFATNPRT